MTIDQKSPKETKPKELDLTFQATNGATWESEFDEDSTVAEARDAALAHFIAEHQMETGEYDLARIHKGEALPPLDPSATLKDAGVKKHDRLVLVPKEPQVDG